MYRIEEMLMFTIGVQGNPCKHPIIFMQDVEYEHVQNLVEFMYEGEVNICQTKLPAFLHTAESLQIRGLSAQSQHKVSAVHIAWYVNFLTG